jgi:hemerythrin
MPLTWDVTMSTGVAKIDHQHQELISKLNALLEAMQKGKGKDEIGKLIAFLGEYVVKHFSDEEAEMERLKCPVATANRIAHQQFVKKFTEIRDRFHKDGVSPKLVIDVQQALLDWFIAHIRSIDTKLALAAKSKAVAVK